MNIFSIFKVKIIVLIKWSHRFPPIKLTIQPRIKEERKQDRKQKRKQESKII